MDKEAIAKQVDLYIENNLKGVPFDKALPKLQDILWEIANKEGTDGAQILTIYMDWKNR